MKTIYLLMKLILGKELTFSHLKSIKLRINLISYNLEKNILLNRFKLLFCILLFPFLFLILLRYSNSKRIIFSSFNNQILNERFENYINYYTKENNSINVLLNNRIYFNFYNLIKKIFLIIKTWFVFFIVAIYSLFDRSQTSLIFINKLLLSYCNGILIEENENKEIYFFRTYRPDIYLLATFLSFKLKYSTIKFMIYNQELYSADRYITIKNANVILCSHYQSVEIDNYIKRGWVQVKSYQIWGPEEIECYGKLKYEKPKYDIGLYSSGDWARFEGLWRAKNINDIKNMKFINNFRYNKFCEILNAVIKYKKDLNYTIKVYLHPYERELLNNFNILPPYCLTLKKENIEYDYESKNSISNIYECKIGIALSSDIILDRWYLNLIGFMLNDDFSKKYKTFDIKYIGEYSKYIFKDIDDLKNKIIEYL